LPLGAFGASRAVMDLISQHKVFHGGTYNTNRVAMSAGLATSAKSSREKTTRTWANSAKKLTEDYRAIVKKSGLQAYVASAGVNGALMLYPQEIRNYRDWTKIDVDLWRHYWFGMVNRGVLAQPYWWMNSGPFPFNTWKRTLTGILRFSRKSRPRSRKPSKSAGVAFVGAAGH